MSRSLPSRFAAALMAAVYLALPGGAWGVRACVHHDGMARQAPVDVAAQGLAGAGESNDPHAGHVGGDDRAPDAATHADRSAHDDGGSHGGCSCLDTCAASATLALPGTFVFNTDGESDATVDASEPDSGAPRIARPHFFLPLPHAPPVASR